MADMQTIKKPGGGGLAVKHGAAINGAGGRFTGSGELTEGQRAFVMYFTANGGNGVQAARDAGYSDARTESYRLRHHPGVQAAIRRELARHIEDGATIGWGVMKRLMLDEATSPQVRFQAAKWSLEAAGHGLQAALGAARLGMTEADKPLSEMSMAEIEQFVERSQAALSALRSVSAPTIEAESVQTSADTETDASFSGAASLPQ